MAYNILLINPWIHDFTAFNLWAKPLGLLYIASTLNYFGYKVDFVDSLNYDGEYINEKRRNGTGPLFFQEIEKPNIFNKVPRRFKRYGMPINIFRHKLRQFAEPLLICVTSHMTYWYPGVFETIEIVKDVFKSAPVVLGGIYATICYEHAKEKSKADYIVTGEGELQVLKLADSLSGQKRNYHFVEMVIEKEIFPAYELYSKLDSVSIITSRGCPFRCTYCASSILNKRFLLRDTDIVVKEIENIVKKLKVKDIAFYDDALFVNSEKHIIPILKALITKKLPIRFHTPNGIHPRYITNDIVNLLWLAGFRTLRLSFEGLSSRVKVASNNKVSVSDIETVMDFLRKNSAPINKPELTRDLQWDIGVYILLGLPGQSCEEVLDSMEFINKIGAKIKIAEYSPVPGTEEFQKALQLSQDLSEEPLMHNKSYFTTIGMNIDYKTFQELKFTAKRLNSELYHTS